MSKRSSRNAINFAGKSWSVGGSFKKNKKKSKSIRSRIIKIERRKKQFDYICKKLDFKIKTLNDKKIYDSLLNDFIRLRAMKGSRIAKLSVKNIDCYISYCKQKNININLNMYFKSQFNTMDFAQKYPYLNFNEKCKNLHKTKYKKNSKKAKRKMIINKIINSVSNEKTNL